MIALNKALSVCERPLAGREAVRLHLVRSE